METIHTNVLVLGSGTAGSNAAKAAVKAGARKVTLIQPRELINTCVEEGCMPSKSILAGSHIHQPLTEVLQIRDAHIDRLKKALTQGLATEDFEIVFGRGIFIDDHTIEITDGNSVIRYTADAIVIATGSHPFIPPIEGLDTLRDKMLISDDVVAKKAQFSKVPKKILTVGGGPIGLELSTFFYEMGADVCVLQRDQALGLFDPEFGEERVRASFDDASFPIYLKTQLTKVTNIEEGVLCTIEKNGGDTEELFDKVLIATGRKPNISNIGIENTSIIRNERGEIDHTNTMQTNVPHIFIAGDVTGHHQILHFAAEMGKVAGHNAVQISLPQEQQKFISIDYDALMLAVSFDQFPSALIGLTEKEATKRGISIITATKHFNSIGLGILKRQEYGMWKIVADAHTGEILGSQILGPDSAGELIQLLTPILHNHNTYNDILSMTWYHPTYAEILKSLARELAHQKH